MKNFLIFISGAAIGVGISWMYHKNKYEQLVEEEVESLREHAKNREESQGMTKDEYEEKNNTFKVNLDDRTCGYTAYSSEDEREAEEAKQYYEEHKDELEEAKEESEQIINNSHYTTTDKSYAEEMADRYKHPYRIENDEVGGLVGFDVDQLNWYSDGIVANDDGEEITNLFELLGMNIDEISKYFNENEDSDAFFIRNMQLKCDYEILRDLDEFR